jgi:hypothetical protein
VTSAESQLKRLSKKQCDNDFETSKLEQIKLTFEERLGSVEKLVSEYRAEKSSMIDKFAIIDKVMSVIEGNVRQIMF